MALHVFQVEALANALNTKLSGKQLSESFSISSDEFFLNFQGFVIKATFYKGEFFLQQVEPKFLPKKNRLKLFPSSLNKEVKAVVCYPLDRMFRLDLEDEHSMVFYLFGKFAQVCYYIDKKYVQHFPLKRNLIEEFPEPARSTIDGLDALDRALPWFKNTFPSVEFKKKTFSTEWQIFCKKQLKGPWFINKESNIYSIDTVERNKVATYDSFLDVYSDFSSLHIGSTRFRELKNGLVHDLSKEIERLSKRLKSLDRKRVQLAENTSYKEKGDLIMANLHTIERGAKKVELTSFETGEDIVIKLNESLSAAKNAERFYRKSKNESVQLKIIEEQISSIKANLDGLKSQKGTIVAIDNHKELKPYLKEKKVETNVRLPYTSKQIEEFEIRIGRSAKDNDELLRRYSHPNDLWFHAKGVAGSHVILRRSSSQKLIPEWIIEKVAAIAAFNSKAKNEELARVIYTEKKYVRKPKRAHPGQVLVERETSVLVRPVKE